MSSYDHNGIANLLSLPLKAPVRTPKIETQEDPILSLSESLMRIKALEIPKNSEPKDEYGYTKKQNREIEKYLTRDTRPKKQDVLNYIEAKKRTNEGPRIDPPILKANINNRYVNKSLNKFENRTSNSSVVTFDPTTQLFTDETRNIAFKDYHQAKRWNDAINGQPTATPGQVNGLVKRLENSRQFGYDPEKEPRKNDSKPNPHRRLI